MSTLRISNIEAKADSSSPTVDEQLRFTNSDGDLMLYLDGRTAGITTVGINTTNQTIKFDANNNVMITGIVTATEFHGTLAVGTSVTYGDNEKEYFGTDLDMSLYHDGSNAYLSNTTGALNLRNTDGSLIDIMSHASARIRVNAGELAVVCNHNSSVDLYYNNNLKFQTKVYGVEVAGTADMDGLVVSGVSTVQALTATTGNFSSSISATGGTFSGDVSVNSVEIADSVRHAGDTDTKIVFTDNQIDIQTGGSSRIYASNSGLYIKSGLPLAFLASSGATPHIKSGGTNAQDLLFTTGSGNPTRMQITSAGAIQCKGETDVQNSIFRVTDATPRIIMSVPSGGLDTRLFNDGSGNFIIGHGTNSDTPTERLRIGSNGSMYLGYNASDGLPVQDGSIPGNLRLFSIHGTGTSLGIKLTNSTTGTTTGDGVDIRLHGQTAMINQNETYDLQLQSKGELAFRTGSTPAERFRITSAGAFGLSGANYGTNGQVLTSQGPGQPVTWKTIAQPADISSISGNIFAGSSGQTLTITGQYFETGQGVLNFTQTSDGVNVNVNVTPSSDTSMTVTVPSSVGNNVTAGNAVTIKFTNASGFVGDGANTTVLALPSGGTITTSGNYRIHTFTSSSNLVLTKSVACEYLVVAGGGGGGGNDGGHDFSGGSGGGGAGGYRVGTVTPSANTHTVTVGGGGSGNNSAASGADGSASAFGSVSSVGGGGGGGCNNAGTNGRAGGSGGGAGGDDGSTVFTGGAGTSGQGNAGGQTGSASHAGGGGGGGANGAGGNGVGHQGGNGGDGSVSSITGSAVTRSGGGGGGNGASASQSSGGSGGGGTGAVRSSSDASAGGTNTGGGGGGAADSNTVSERAGANGGSGIVIVRYDVTNL